MTTIERVTRHNYHLFDDMVKWRMTGAEPTPAEREASKHSDFSGAYDDLEHPGFYCPGALRDGRFVAWISLMYTPKIGRRCWKKGVIYVDELRTAPEFRRNGIATQLMQKAFDCQRELGAVEVRAYVGADNAGAQDLYKKCGMQASGTAVYMRSEAD